MAGIHARDGIGLLVTTLAVLCAGAAHATSISFVWVEHNGSGISTSSLQAGLGDSAVLEMRVNVGAGGVLGISQSLEYDPFLLQPSAWTVCPEAPGNVIEGGCGTLGFGQIMMPIGAHNIVTDGDYDLDGLLEIRPLAAVGFPSAPPYNGQSGGSFALAHVTFDFVAGGSAAVDPYFMPGVDGALSLDNEYNFLHPASGATVVITNPEPSTALLFASGIASLAFVRRLNGGRGRGRCRSG